MLILISIGAQYLQNVVFSFEKGSNDQNHSFSSFHHTMKKSRSKISYCSHLGDSPYPLQVSWLQKGGFPIRQFFFEVEQLQHQQKID